MAASFLSPCCSSTSSSCSASSFATQPPPPPRLFLLLPPTFSHLVTSKFSSQHHPRTVSPKKLARISPPKQGVASSRCQGSGTDEKTPFGYTRKDVVLIGLGLTVFGVGLKYGLELFGVDPLKAGNVVQLVMVLGLTVGWISTYLFRVSTKEMTYAKQLKDYENKVMQKRLEELPEAELESLLAQVEEEKRRLQQSQD